jgi:hypothetical protein
MSGVSSDFSRRIFVENGVVRRNRSSIGISGRDRRVWAASAQSLSSVSETQSS